MNVIIIIEPMSSLKMTYDFPGNHTPSQRNSALPVNNSRYIENNFSIPTSLLVSY